MRRFEISKFDCIIAICNVMALFLYVLILLEVDFVTDSEVLNYFVLVVWFADGIIEICRVGARHMANRLIDDIDNEEVEETEA